MSKKLRCNECGAEISSDVPDNTIILGYTICHECLGCMNIKIVNNFFDEWMKAGEHRKKLIGETKEKEYEIWVEGYMTATDHMTATCYGSVMARSFKEACDKLAKKQPLFAAFYDSSKLTHWGCKLHDNEKDARKYYG